MIVEWSIESIEEMELAQQLGIQRVELCSSLDLGGLTPSIGLIELCSKVKGPEIHTMIRPRAGDFAYSLTELELIYTDIKSAKTAGSDGVVFGVLDKNNVLNIDALDRLIKLSKSLELETTFHRAFDVVSNPFKTLHQLIELGFDRILTSGQQQKAILGLELIKKLVQQSNGRIEIMAGSGIDTSNAKTFIKAGINNLHCTARKRIDRLDEFGMGVQHKPDQQKIENILQVLAT